MGTRALAALLLLFSLTVFPCSAGDQELGEDDNGKQLVIQTGEHFNVSLSESGGTGYAWNLTKYDKNDLGLVAETYRSVNTSGNKTGGTSGYRVWTFKGLRDGEARIDAVKVGPTGDVSTRYSINVIIGEGDGEEPQGGLLPGFEPFLVVMAAVGASLLISINKARNKT